MSVDEPLNLCCQDGMPLSLLSEEIKLLIFPHLVFYRKVCAKSAKNFILYIPPALIRGLNASHARLRICKTQDHFGLLVEFLHEGEVNERVIERNKKEP